MDDIGMDVPPALHAICSIGDCRLLASPFPQSNLLPQTLMR
jgi:hypothetical protein